MNLRATVRRILDAPAAYAVAFVVLVLSTDLTFRRRDPTLAVEGVIDTAIIVELAIWGLVAAWAATQLLLSGRLRFGVIREAGPTLRVLLLLTALFLATSVLTGGPLPVVRAVQYAVIVAVGLLTYGRTAGDPEAAEAFWNAMRRGIWIVIAVAVAVSIGLAQYFPDLGSTEIIPGEGPRFRLFRTHPITSAGLIGLAMVALAGSWLGAADPWFSRPRVRSWAAVAFTVLTVLLLATKARGALFATLAALAILIALTWSRRRRGIAVLAASAGGGVFLLGIAIQFVREVVIRGQTMEQLLSLTGRTQLFEIAFDIFREEPIIGHGYHAARMVFLDQVQWAGHSHNAWVEVAVNNGVVGLALMAFLFVRLTWRLWRRWRSGATQQERSRGAEGLALTAFVLLLGVVEAGVAGAPGFEVAALIWAVLLADLQVSQPAARTPPVPLQG